MLAKATPFTPTTTATTQEERFTHDPSRFDAVYVSYHGMSAAEIADIDERNSEALAYMQDCSPQPPRMTVVPAESRDDHAEIYGDPEDELEAPEHEIDRDNEDAFFNGLDEDIDLKEFLARNPGIEAELVYTSIIRG